MTKAIAIVDDLYSLIVAKDKDNEKFECTKVEHESELRALVVNVLLLQTRMRSSMSCRRWARRQRAPSK